MLFVGVGGGAFEWADCQAEYAEEETVGQDCGLGFDGEAPSRDGENGARISSVGGVVAQRLKVVGYQSSNVGVTGVKRRASSDMQIGNK